MTEDGRPQGEEAQDPTAVVVAPPEERVEPSTLRGQADSSLGTPTAETGNAPLFDKADVGAMDQRWQAVQAGFVDEPRRAVEDADRLVQEAIGRLTETFSRERARLEQQWSRGEDVSTEDLRIALQRYRSFFQRLLAA